MFQAFDANPVPMTTKKGIDLKTTAIMNFAFVGLSALMHFATIFWAFTLMWKTFLFRFGLTKRLRKEFPLLWCVLIST